MNVINVFCDFDGTITWQDTTDAVLEAFAEPEFRGWERKWEEGFITATECMERQARLIRAEPNLLRAFLSHITIDPGFYMLQRGCFKTGASLVIVSDGIDFLMEEVLRVRGLERVPHYSNHLSWNDQGSPFLSFPYQDPDCDGGCGVCKCRLLKQHGPAYNIYIGDGLSDRCIAHRADRLFAKKRLQDYCRREGIAYEPFETLSEVALALFGKELEEEEGRNEITS